MSWRDKVRTDGNNVLGIKTEGGAAHLMCANPTPLVGGDKTFVSICGNAMLSNTNASPLMMDEKAVTKPSDLVCNDCLLKL